MKKPLKEKLKQIGGGHLLKEEYAWERKFGEPLPTLDSVQNKHQNKVNEWTLDADAAGEVLVDVSDELAYYIKKAKNREKWGKKHFKSASKLIHEIRGMIMVFKRM